MTIQTLPQDPSDVMASAELDTIILQMGSLLSILQNKKTNVAKLLITSFIDTDFQTTFKQLSELSSSVEILKELVDRYPTVCKSKIVINALGKHVR